MNTTTLPARWLTARIHRSSDEGSRPCCCKAFHVDPSPSPARHVISGYMIFGRSKSDPIGTRPKFPPIPAMILSLFKCSRYLRRVCKSMDTPAQIPLPHCRLRLPKANRCFHWISRQSSKGRPSPHSSGRNLGLGNTAEVVSEQFGSATKRILRRRIDQERFINPVLMPLNGSTPANSASGSLFERIWPSTS